MDILTRKKTKICDLSEKNLELLLYYSPDGRTMLSSPLMAVENVVLIHTSLVKRWCFNTPCCVMFLHKSRHLEQFELQNEI